ncbi:MAG TPA: class I SAM-dependent methyltransferase [Streptosporangiaceae bacterium]|nr:class I SAM-dependent methyltransferase [Streptosporangiaceae bacterium]
MGPGNSTTPHAGHHAGTAHLGRLLEFAQPGADDVALDVAYGDGPVAAALRTHLRHVASVDAGPRPEPRHPGRRAAPDTAPHMLPTVLAASPGAGADAVHASTLALPYKDRVFTLVTAQLALYSLADPLGSVREMLRVCRPDGRLIIAGRVRTNAASAARDRLERLRDPAHAGTPALSGLTGLLTAAGARIRRLDVFVVERPAEPWLAGCDEAGADQIRAAMFAEIDGGPRTGVRPRLIGGELWFSQSWAHIAAVPT